MVVEKNGKISIHCKTGEVVNISRDGYTAYQNTTWWKKHVREKIKKHKTCWWCGQKFKYKDRAGNKRTRTIIAHHPHRRSYDKCGRERILPEWMKYFGIWGDIVAVGQCCHNGKSQEHMAMHTDPKTRRSFAPPWAQVNYQGTKEKCKPKTAKAPWWLILGAILVIAAAAAYHHFIGF